MALVTTPAIVLHAFKYGESSKIVRLLTPDHGMLSAIAKGAHQPRSRFGARLQVLSEGVAQLYLKPTRDLQTLGAFDVTAQRAELAADMRRYATAAAVAELIIRFSPEEPRPEVFDLVSGLFDELSAASSDRLEPLGIGAIWRVVAGLGFSPSLQRCARDGSPLPAGAARFSVVEGGLLCRRCAAARSGRSPLLQPDDRAALGWLVGGARGELQGTNGAPGVLRRAAAHRRLVARFVVQHLGEGGHSGPSLNALTFWETMSWAATS